MDGFTRLPRPLRSAEMNPFLPSATRRGRLRRKCRLGRIRTGGGKAPIRRKSRGRVKRAVYAWRGKVGASHRESDLVQMAPMTISHSPSSENIPPMKTATARFEAGGERVGLLTG